MSERAKTVRELAAEVLSEDAAALVIADPNLDPDLPLDRTTIRKIRRSARPDGRARAVERERAEFRRACDELSDSFASLNELRRRARILATEGDLSALVPDRIDEWCASAGRAISAFSRLEGHVAASTVLRDDEDAHRRIAELAETAGIDLLRHEYARIRAILRDRRRLDRLETHRPGPEPVADATCAEDGCSRVRHFFDETGVGYCKRHGNDRGLRPHGKVT